MIKFKFFPIIFCIFFVFSGCSKKNSLREKNSINDSTKMSLNVVASTVWVASIADLAGIENIEIITPSTLKHPPEYEITPDDILKISKADYFLYAGYERMMEKISNALELPLEKKIKVSTKNNTNVITEMVKMLSKIANTEEVAEKNLSEFYNQIEEMKEKIKDLTQEKNLTFYVNINQIELARELELNVAGTFGPDPLTAEQLSKIATQKYDVIIDNWHNPVAGPATVVSSDSKIVVWRNFPEEMEVGGLLKMIRRNVESLEAAMIILI